MSFKQIIQGFSFALFILAFIGSPDPFLSLWPADGFIRMDPIVGLGTWLADRHFGPLLWIGLLILPMSAVLGRIFCGYLCPMGITIDIADRLLLTYRRPLRKSTNGHPVGWPSRRLKYKLLVFILGAGGLGVSLVFIASPLSLITRFYGWILYPVFCFMADKGVNVLRPVADALDMTAMVYAVVDVPRYDLQWVTVTTLMAVLFGGLWAPRFWCRYLCPSGALMAVFSRRSILRRKVSRACTQCGLCEKACPMGAIGNSPQSDARLTQHCECISCLSCAKACPIGAISFNFTHALTAGRQDPLPTAFSAERRRLLGAGMSGGLAAILTYTGMKSPLSDPGPGSIVHPSMIRPPGSVPETAFLARCIRCGACMQACPTNSLQPLGLNAGLSALFSPVVTPRRGPCEPSCNACGSVCPTGAISPLPVVEKLNAKIGTARICRQKCLAWEMGKKCLICDEVCPFDAVEFRKPPGSSIAVPFINEIKCAGCGFCEHYCPVLATSAIVVEPMMALRLPAGSYRAAALEKGYRLELGRHTRGGNYGNTGQEKAPGQRWGNNRLPPGFTQ